jgi:serine/threonine protein kinase
MGDERAVAVGSVGNVSHDVSLASSHGDEPSTSAPGSHDAVADEEKEVSPPLARLSGGWIPPTGPKHTHYKPSSKRLGGGAFGEVLAGRRVADGTAVALKRIPIRVPGDGIPDNVLRELKTMQHLAGRSRHVLELLDHYPKGNAMVLVLELCPGGDLRALLGTEGNERALSMRCVKGATAQILAGVAACHFFGVAHRDVKPGNVVVARDGALKLADFGLARFIVSGNEEGKGHGGLDGLDGLEGLGKDDSNLREAAFRERKDQGTRELTGIVQTRWYRAPEILFGSRSYGFAIDVWSAGVILGELLSPCGPILQGETDVDQLAKTLGMFGTPSETRWPEASDTPDYEKIVFEAKEPMAARDALPSNCDAPGLGGTEFFYKLCQLDPKMRPTAGQALRDSFFQIEPSAATPEETFRELRSRRMESRVRSRAGKEVPSSFAATEIDLPLGARSLTDPELREALMELGLDEEIKALDGVRS